VGIIGSPNAGKSSLLAAVTAAKPKIADYPFTTIEPILGVVKHQDADFVMADIPGLLEGAHEGVGLGREFLRHIERTRLLIHVVDGSLGDPLMEYKKVRKEIGLYSETMLEKPEVVVINKIDIANNAKGLQEEVAKIRGDGIKVMWISAATRKGLSSLMNRVVEKLNELRGPFQEDAPPMTKDLTILHPETETPAIKEIDGEYVVHDARSERISKMIDSSNWNAQVQFYEHLRKNGVIAALEKSGISSGDVYRIGNLKLEWS
jgi:GTP-binding protein